MSSRFVTSPGDAPRRPTRSLVCLGQVTANAGTNKAWKSVVAAVKTKWREERTEALAQRLADYRSQLTLRILLVLNNNHAAQPDQASSLRDEIVEVLAVTCQDLKASFNQAHSETIAALFTTRDGNLTALTSREAESTFSERLASGHAIKTSVTYSQDNNPPDSPSGQQPTPMTDTVVADYAKEVLELLHFRGITDRHCTIREAHAMPRPSSGCGATTTTTPRPPSGTRWALGSKPPTRRPALGAVTGSRAKPAPASPRWSSTCKATLAPPPTSASGPVTPIS